MWFLLHSELLQFQFLHRDTGNCVAYNNEVTILAETVMEHNSVIQVIHYEETLWCNDKVIRTYSVASVRERTLPTKQPPFVGEVSANFCG
jgi:hypothetical protein